MDSKTETVSDEEHQRIRNEAGILSKNFSSDPMYGSGTYFGYARGAESEHIRMNTILKEKTAIIKELLRAIYHGEMELRITYQRHTPYKGGSSLWLMQEMLEKYKSYRDEK